MALQHPAFLNCLSVVDKASVGNNSVGKSVVDGVDGSSVDGVGNNGSVDSVGNDRGVVDHRGSVYNRGGMDYWGNSMSNTVAHYSVAHKTVMTSNTMPNHSCSSEDLGGRRSGSYKGCQSNEDL